ncbi:MAG: serine protease [Myxococcota bacterium]
MSPPPPSPPRRELGSLLRAVVKVMCVADAPDYDQPWQSHGASSCTGSGAVIETERGLRILTNAHCVANHVFVEVRRYGLSQKFEAEVEALGHECDLALLRVEDDRFFHGVTPIPIGDLPALSARVSVCGYPIGGERLSLTEGIVSRIELVAYAQSSRELLAVQIDAAINEGNSGGPVFEDGKLVGVAFQALEDAESVGYMIASDVVRHFLEDIDNGRYDGFPDVGVTVQPLESRAHRRALGLPATCQEGVLVKRVAFGSSAWGALLPGDVLLSVDGVGVAPDGAVVLREGELIHFQYVVSRRHVGDLMPVVVWRDGRATTLELSLTAPRSLVAEDRYDVRPSFFVYGGLLFVPLTRDFLKTWGDGWWQAAPRELVALYESGIVTEDRREVVVLQKVLADRVNQGYHDVDNQVVVAVDGQPVRSLRHLVERVEARPAATFTRFRMSDGAEIVLDRLEVRTRHRAILDKFGVPHDRSEDLRPPELPPNPGLHRANDGLGSRASA